METHDLFLCSCAPDGGISRFALRPDGSLTPLATWKADRPMYAVPHDGMLYALLLSPAAGKAESGAVALRVGKDGGLSAVGGLRMLGGECACHLAVSPSGKFLYTANYLSGSVSQLPIGAEGMLGAESRLIRHVGGGVHPRRQEGPHAHCTVFTPDGKHLCVVDLGLDRIVVYRVDDADGIVEQPVGTCAMEPGSGPRHLAFSRDGTLAYCANELESGVTVLEYRDGRLEPLSTYPTLPPSFPGESFCAAIRVSPCGRRLYVTNRGHDSIACFSIEGQALRLTGIVGCGGHWPRDFDLSPDGTLAVCANERSNDVSTFRVDPGSGALTPTGFRHPLATPLCVTFPGT